MPSYEEQTAVVWYEMFCEYWANLSDEPPPPLADIAGDDMGEDPEWIANNHYNEYTEPYEPSLFERYTGGGWDH